MLQAALNGPHADGVPRTAEELAADAAACVAAGAEAIHLHPRGPDGRESLDPEVVDATVRAVREACGVPVGVSTGAWIEPDLERRLALIGAWREPDYASVNLSEPGHERVMRALAGAGIGIEAGVWTPEDAAALAATGLPVLRVLVEPLRTPLREAPALVQAVHAALDAHGLGAPRLQHGDGEATWWFVADALRRGLDTRIGLEDLPGATPNADLVAAAAALRG